MTKNCGCTGVLLFAALAALPAAADEPFRWDIWSNIAVQQGGRIKPLDTLAWEFVTGVTGRSRFRPAAFATISPVDISDWAKVAQAIARGESGAEKRLRQSLPADLVASLSEMAPTDWDAERLEREVRQVEAALNAKARAHAEQTGDIGTYAEIKGELIAAEPELAARFEAFEQGRSRLSRIGETKSRLIRALNESLKDRALWGASGVAKSVLDSKFQPLADQPAGRLSAAELARLNRAVLDHAIPGLRSFAPSGPAIVEMKKYDPVELYVTWLLTWQGWDKLHEYKDLGQGRDDEIYWRFHQPDAWDATPMLDARYEALAPRLLGETPEAVSPRTVAGNQVFQAWVMRARDEMRDDSAGGMHADARTLEKKGLEVFEAYLNYTHCRLGYNLVVGAKPVASGADWRETHDWLPLVGLIVANDVTAERGLDSSTVRRVREGFLRARAGLIAKNPAEFNAGSATFRDALEELGRQSPIYPSKSELAREVHYNRLQPFYYTTVFAVVATVFLAVSLGVSSRLPFFVGYGSLIVALGMMVYGMALRVWISGRPPVTNMYETILWSSFIASVLAVTLGLVYRQRIIPLTAAIVITLATLLAHLMPISMGATIDPLQPVLRKNFWLVIHVLTIVGSYGAFLLAWALGNVGLSFYLLGKHRPEVVRPMSVFAYRAIQVGFLMLAAGTILGGWWAADSWGRFWGWDPKETWALIALLGYAVILHARFAGLVRTFGLLAGAVIAFSGVVMAWYGVNFVLGAGLHAYAFGDGGQPYVLSAVLLNLAYVGLAYRAYRRGAARLQDGAGVEQPAGFEPTLSRGSAELTGTAPT